MKMLIVFALIGVLLLAGCTTAEPKKEEKKVEEVKKEEPVKEVPVVEEQVVEPVQEEPPELPEDGELDEGLEILDDLEELNK
ncbi:hypothetical protein HYT84_00675 [Candidatus Micrarchaeota archaeon]|nr:hypothetical protein [Candidatus Micrarchaeota archaeon]